MNDQNANEHRSGLDLEFEFRDPPQKVWRAIAVPELRERWLPESALIDSDPVTVTPGQEIRYQMRDDAPPFLESSVTFKVTPNGSGGTYLRIIHKLTDKRCEHMARVAANSNGPPRMLAA